MTSETQSKKQEIFIKRNTKTILVGAGGSGKDYAKKTCSDNKMLCDISYTTRPIRNGEIDGVDYHFITKEEFEDMIKKDEFLQFNMFGNGHYYGTSLKSWEANEIFIFSPNVISLIKINKGRDFFDFVEICYLNIKEDVRKNRLEARNDVDSTERRLKTDKEDFANFFDYTQEVTDPFFFVKITN